MDQAGARLQKKLGTVESQLAEQVAALNRLSTWLWLRPVAVGVAICLAVSLAGWGHVTRLAHRIESQREKLAEFKSDIKNRQATLRELEKKTWGVGFADTAGGNYITWPGHYQKPFKGTGSNATYAGKWVAKLAEE